MNVGHNDQQVLWYVSELFRGQTRGHEYCAVGALVRYFLHVLNGAIQCNIFGLPNFPSDNQNWQTGCPKDNHENFLKSRPVSGKLFSLCLVHISIHFVFS